MIDLVIGVAAIVTLVAIRLFWWRSFMSPLWRLLVVGGLAILALGEFVAPAPHVVILGTFPVIFGVAGHVMELVEHAALVRRYKEKPRR